MSLILLQASNWTTTGIVLVAAIPSIITAAIALAAARAYYKTGVSDRLTLGWKAELELTEKQKTRLERQAKEAQDALARKEAEYEVLSKDFSQLSALFAIKSILLEALTNFYKGMGDTFHTEGIEEVARRMSPVKVKGEDDIHSTNPHTTKT